MEILIETYQALKELNLVKTEADFSLNWLHKSQRYYSMVKHSKNDASVEALCSLLAHLKEHSQQKEIGPEGEQGKLVVTRLLEQRLDKELHNLALAGREQKCVHGNS